MIRKTYVLGIVILLGLSSFSPLVISNTPRGMNSFASMQSRPGNVITVDDEPGDADYTSIKEALNHSTAGDTIEVYSGIYYESNFTLSKPNMTLQGIPHELGGGNDSGTPLIKGNDTADVFFLTNRSITLAGFHIDNRGTWNCHNGIRLEQQATHCRISGNEIGYCWDGIDCFTSYNLIENNSIYGFDGLGSTGIYAHGPNEIYNNTICGKGGGVGIDIGFNSSRIINNIVTNCAVGMQTQGSYHFIANNTIMSNNMGGIGIAGDYNICINNTIEHNDNNPYNTGSGVGLGQHSSFNKIMHNKINFHVEGVGIWDSSYNEISYNTITNSIYGIRLTTYLSYVNDAITSHNTISYNNIINNTYGVYLDCISKLHPKVRVTSNTISRNNFLQSEKEDAFFNLGFFHCNNTWDRNYWNESLSFPKIIHGRTGVIKKLMVFPWINVDWHPAKEPN